MQAAEADVRASLGDRAQEVLGVVDLDQREREAAFARETRDQVVVEALDAAVGRREPGDRSGAHRDDQRTGDLRRRQVAHAAAGDDREEQRQRRRDESRRNVRHDPGRRRGQRSSGLDTAWTDYSDRGRAGGFAAGEAIIGGPRGSRTRLHGGPPRIAWS